MSLYIIEDRYGALQDSSVNYNYAKSLQQSRYPDGHIVELVPAKPKVQVSQEGVDMPEKARVSIHTKTGSTVSIDSRYARKETEQEIKNFLDRGDEYLTFKDDKSTSIIPINSIDLISINLIEE